MSYILRTALRDYGSRTLSQNDEDGIIAAIFEDIPPPRNTSSSSGSDQTGGSNDYSNGLEGNCVLLREQGWQGLMMDGGDHPGMDVRKEFVSPLNVNSLFRKYDVPHDLDIVSIDVDGQDFWIWMACGIGLLCSSSNIT